MSTRSVSTTTGGVGSVDNGLAGPTAPRTGGGPVAAGGRPSMGPATWTASIRTVADLGASTATSITAPLAVGLARLVATALAVSSASGWAARTDQPARAAGGVTAAIMMLVPARGPTCAAAPPPVPAGTDPPTTAGWATRAELSERLRSTSTPGTGGDPVRPQQSPGRAEPDRWRPEQTHSAPRRGSTTGTGSALGDADGRPAGTRHGTAGHGTAGHDAAGHDAARHGTARHGTARHGTAGHGTAGHDAPRCAPACSAAWTRRCDSGRAAHHGPSTCRTGPGVRRRTVV